MREYKIYTYEGRNNEVSVRNRHLRDFMHNELESWCVLYNTKSEVPRFTEAELSEYVGSVIQVSARTGIHYFTGVLEPVTTIDYGDGVLVEVGTMSAQRVVIEFVSREAVNTVGYFDARMSDNCYAGDYAFRLSEKNLYPKQSTGYLPWLFDVKSNTRTTAKHVYSEISSGWYNYKYNNFPQLIQQDTIDNLKQTLKNLKKKNA